MIEIQATIGRIQLKRMVEWSAKRNENALSVLKAFESFKAIRIPNFKCNRDCIKDCSSLNQCQHAQYKCYVYVENAHLKEGWSRDRIIQEIEMRGVPCFQGGCSEVYLEKLLKVPALYLKPFTNRKDVRRYITYVLASSNAHSRKYQQDERSDYGCLKIGKSLMYAYF